MEAHGAPGDKYRLAKVLGVLAIAASAFSHEYGATINYAATNSLGVYPLVEGLVPLAMLVAGILLIPKVFLYMRFSHVMPRAGSTYVWIGRGLSEPVSFVINFLQWIGLTAAIGFIAFTFGTFLGQALTGAGVRGGAVFVSPAGHIVLGLAVIWVIYWAHISGVRLYGLLVNILFFLILASVVLICAFGFGTAPSHFITMAESVAHVHLAAPTSAPAPTLAAFIAVTFVFIAAYGGINGASALGGEARDATRTMPRGIFFGWLTALVAYTAVVYALFHAAPWWAVTGLIHGKASALATAPGLISLLAPQWLGTALSLAVAVIVGKTAIPQMMVASRLVFAWAEDGMLPARYLHTSKSKAPDAALLLTAALASVFLIQSATEGWAIGIIVRSFTVLVVLAVVALSALNVRFNSRFRGVAWAQEVGRGPWVVVFAILAIIISIVLLVGGVIVPNTPLVFQPLFQGVIAALVALWVYRAARARLHAEGRDLASVVAELPID